MKNHFLKMLGTALMVVLSNTTLASGGEFPLDQAPNLTTDMAALQRGAKLFVNYCLNCHGASMMRYNRLKDIGLTDEQIKDNLLFTTDKVGGMMNAAIDPKEAKVWFGATPPDLSVIARARGADWLYTYMRTFYKDDSRPTGWNNMVYDKVAMPHALWELQGTRKAKFEEVEDAHGHGTTHKFVGFEQVTPGTMNAVDYDHAVADLVGYLEWMDEPNQNFRKKLGVVVLFVLCIFMFCAIRLNAAFWKDIK